MARAINLARFYKLNWKECKRYEFSKGVNEYFWAFLRTRRSSSNFPKGKWGLKWHDFQGINYGANFLSLVSHYFTLQLVSLWLSLIFSTNEFSSIIPRLLNLVFTFLYKKEIKKTWLDHRQNETKTFEYDYQ